MKNMYRSSPLRRTLNTNVITALGMCKACTEAVHCVAVDCGMSKSGNCPVPRGYVTPKTWEWPTFVFSYLSKCLHQTVFGCPLVIVNSHFYMLCHFTPHSTSYDPTLRTSVAVIVVCFFVTLSCLVFWSPF